MIAFLQFLSTSLLLGLALAEQPLKEAHASLPMAAYTREAGVPIYSGPDSHENYAVFEKAGEFVGAWASKPGWVRITPPAFTIEGWVRVSDVQLDPSGQARSDAPYLEKLVRLHEEYVEGKTLTACAVVTKEIDHLSNSPSSEVLSWVAAEEYQPGNILTIYRQRGKFYETRPDEKWIQGSAWVAKEFLEIAEPAEDEKGDSWCASDSTWSGSSYTFAVSGVYRDGPSDRFPVAAPYNAGEKVEVHKRYAGGWWATSPTHGRNLLWFRDADILPIGAYTSIETIRLHAAPDSGAAVLIQIKTAHPYFILYERASDWYRVTPDAFTPEAWVSARGIVPTPNHQTDPSVTEYYLSALAPHSQQLKRSKESSQPFFSGPLAIYLPWTWILVIAVSVPAFVWWFFEDAVSLHLERQDEKAYFAGLLAAALTFFSLITLVISSRISFILGAVLTLLLCFLPPLLHSFCLLWAHIHYYRSPSPQLTELQATLASDGYDSESIASALRASLRNAPRSRYRARSFRKHLNQVLELLRTYSTLADNLEKYKRAQKIMEVLRNYERREA